MSVPQKELSRQLGDLAHYGVHVRTRYDQSANAHLNGRIRRRVADLKASDSYDYEFGTWYGATQQFASGTGNDMRQTIYHGYDTNGDTMLAASGNPIDHSALEPFKTTLDVKIVAGGNLVARETYL